MMLNLGWFVYRRTQSCQFLLHVKDLFRKLGRFQEIFSYKINVNDFRDYVEDVLQNGENHTMPPSIRKAKSIVGAIAVSSAEAERGFSKMNVIYSDKRSRLLVENVSNLMTIDLLGLPQRVGSHIICKIMATPKSFC